MLIVKRYQFMESLDIVKYKQASTSLYQKIDSYIMMLTLIIQVFPFMLLNGPLCTYLFSECAAPDMLTVHCRRLWGVYSTRCMVIVFNQTEDKMCCDSFSSGSNQIGHLAYTNTQGVWEWAY